MDNTRKEIKQMLRNGIYCQFEIFNRVYPTFNGHYSTLRNMIAEEKTHGIS